MVMTCTTTVNSIKFEWRKYNYSGLYAYGFSPVELIVNSYIQIQLLLGLSFLNH